MEMMTLDQEELSTVTLCLLLLFLLWSKKPEGKTHKVCLLNLNFFWWNNKIILAFEIYTDEWNKLYNGFVYNFMYYEITLCLSF
jgi:hypothetical protein